jgi:hypothetical protein
MRKALNDNPIVQIGALAALALLVGFLLITRMSHKSPDSSSATSTSSSSAASVASPSASSSDAAATTPSTATPDATSSALSTPAPTGSAAPAAAAPAGDFVAGPGLPAAVVDAYKADRVVVLLVVRRNGIDDEAVKRSVESMAGSANVALFVTNAGHIARYSRIAAGVNVDRVPALIVLRPRKLAHGTPTALVSYGFRGPDSVAQAIRDATYKGPTNQPYYPK